MDWTARYSNHNPAGQRLERLHHVVSGLRDATTHVCATPALSAVECEPAPEPLGDVEQLRAALRECGNSVAELSRQSGHPVEDVRALLVAEGLIGPKLRRGSLTDEQLHRAGQDYKAGATLRQLAKRYGVGKTYLRQHLIRIGVQLRPPSGGRRPAERDQQAVVPTAH